MTPHPHWLSTGVVTIQGLFEQPYCFDSMGVAFLSYVEDAISHQIPWSWIFHEVARALGVGVVYLEISTGHPIISCSQHFNQFWISVTFSISHSFIKLYCLLFGFLFILYTDKCCFVINHAF